MVAARLFPLAVHSLLHDNPMSVVGDDESMQIKLKAVLDSGAVDLGDQAAGHRQGGSVEPDPVADCNQLVRCLS
jgi:hypothetical protein